MASFYNFINSLKAYDYFEEREALRKEIESETDKKRKERLYAEKTEYWNLYQEREKILNNIKRDLYDLKKLELKADVNFSLVMAIRDYNKKVYGKNKSLIFFNQNKFYGKERRMSKKVYNSIKKNKDLMVSKSLGRKNVESLYNLAENYITADGNKYGSSSFDMHSLSYALYEGVYQYNSSILDVRRKLDNLNSLKTYENKKYFERKEEIKSTKSSFVSFPTLNKKLIKLDNICSEVLNISLEIEYNEQLMKVAREASCTDLQIYAWLENHTKNLKDELNKKNLKAIEMYNSINLSEQRKNIHRLDDLYDDLIKLSSANLDDNITLEFETRYNEMKSILNANPDLNIKKYSEFIKNYSNYTKKKNKEEKNISTSNPNLAKRKDYYSSYMHAKVTDKYVQKISFSEYLKRTVPFEKELIEIEENREENARTIFKEYITYYIHTNKSSVLSFKEFAKKVYFDEFVDVPIESEMVYKGMMI